MPDRFPRLTAREAIAFVERRGFRFIRQTGSHAVYRNEKGISVTIPRHAKKILHPKLVKQITQAADQEI